MTRLLFVEIFIVDCRDAKIGCLDFITFDFISFDFISFALI